MRFNKAKGVTEPCSTPKREVRKSLSACLISPDFALSNFVRTLKSTLVVYDYKYLHYVQ